MTIDSYRGACLAVNRHRRISGTANQNKELWGVSKRSLVRHRAGKEKHWFLPGGERS